jgi:hypothetical protein
LSRNVVDSMSSRGSLAVRVVGVVTFIVNIVARPTVVVLYSCGRQRLRRPTT